MDNPKCLSWWIADSNMWKKLHDEVSAELSRARVELDASRKKERELAADLLASDAMKERENWKRYAESLEKECDEWERTAKRKAAAEEEAEKWLRIADTNAKARDKWEATAEEWQAAAGVWKAAAKKWEDGTLHLQGEVNRWKDATKKLEDEAKGLRNEVAHWKDVSNYWYEVAAGRGGTPPDGVAAALTSALEKQRGEIRAALKTAASDYFGEDYVKDKGIPELAEVIGKTLMRSEEDNTYWRTKYADSVKGQAETEEKLKQAEAEVERRTHQLTLAIAVMCDNCLAEWKREMRAEQDVPLEEGG